MVVVTYQSAAVVPGFLQALPAAMQGVGDWRLFVADNGSSDATLALVDELAPSAEVVSTGANLGYAAALNAAVAASRGADAWLFANPDLRLRPGSVALMLELLRGSTGVVVPRLVDGEGLLLPSLRRAPALHRLAAEALLGGRRAGRWGVGELVVDASAYDVETVADWATGAALLCSRTCLEQTGPWDESYFLYSEETDFLLRARERGFGLRLQPRATAVHLGGEAHADPRLYGLLTLNRARHYRSRHGPVAAGVFRALLVGYESCAAGPRCTGPPCSTCCEDGPGWTACPRQSSVCSRRASTAAWVRAEPRARTASRPLRPSCAAAPGSRSRVTTARARAPASPGCTSRPVTPCTT